MEKSQYDKFVDVLNSCADLVGKRRPTELALSLYWKTLDHFELATVLQAITLHLKDPDIGMFMPKPADIIRQIEGGGDERSLKAWTKVYDAIEEVGSWTMLVFDDARIHAVIEDMGGWMRFCAVTTDDLPFLRNEFCKRYRGYMQHAPIRYPALIKGEGGFGQSPRLVGNQQLAQRVMLGGGESRYGTEIGRIADDAFAVLAAPAGDRG